MKDKIRKREAKAIRKYFNLKVVPEPIKLSPSKIKDLNEHGLGIHFIPEVDYKEFPDGSLSEFFFKLTERKILRKESLNLKSGWVLIEKEPKPDPNKLWIRNNKFFELLSELGFNFRSLCKLYPKLYFAGWNDFKDRFGTSRKEVEEKILPSINNLKIDNLRLPKYLEYVYLGECFYSGWGNTKSWEWLEDRLKNDKFLAAGYEKASALGADPYTHWSTILSYRLLIDLKD